MQQKSEIGGRKIETIFLHNIEKQDFMSTFLYDPIIVWESRQQFLLSRYVGQLQQHIFKICRGLMLAAALVSELRGCNQYTIEITSSEFNDAHLIIVLFSRTI